VRPNLFDGFGMGMHEFVKHSATRDAMEMETILPAVRKNIGGINRNKLNRINNIY
jgi:hypothetical protein